MKLHFLIPVLFLAHLQSGEAQPFLKPLLEVTGERSTDAVGTSVLALGDINGDGWPDVGVSVGGRRQFWIYYGGPGILDDKVDAVFEGGSNAIVLDLNGDGYKELITIRHQTMDGRDTALVYMGKASASLQLDTVPTNTIPSKIGGTDLGRYMSVGDLNGDGIQDLAINEDYLRGRVYVFMGKSDFNGVPDFTGTIDSAYVQYGNEVQIANVNGDGFDDLVFGLWYSGDSGTWHRLHIHHGGMNWTFDYRNPSQAVDSRYLEIPDSSGTNLDWSRMVDVNGDEIADICFRIKVRDQLFVFYGQRGLISSKPNYIIKNPIPGRYEGFFVLRPIHSAGDINKDSFKDYALRLGAFTQPYLVYNPGSRTGHVAGLQFSWKDGGYSC